MNFPDPNDSRAWYMFMLKNPLPAAAITDPPAFFQTIDIAEIIDAIFVFRTNVPRRRSEEAYLTKALFLITAQLVGRRVNKTFGADREDIILETTQNLMSVALDPTTEAHGNVKKYFMLAAKLRSINTVNCWLNKKRQNAHLSLELDDGMNVKSGDDIELKIIIEQAIDNLSSDEQKIFTQFILLGNDKTSEEMTARSVRRKVEKVADKLRRDLSDLGFQRFHAETASGNYAFGAMEVARFAFILDVGNDLPTSEKIEKWRQVYPQFSDDIDITAAALSMINQDEGELLAPEEIGRLLERASLE